MPTIPNLPTYDLSTILTLAFYLLALMYVVFSVVLYYHWMQYAVDKRVRGLSLAAFFLSTLPLIGIMGIIVLTN